MWRTLRSWIDKNAWLSIGVWLSALAVISGSMLIVDGDRFINYIFPSSAPDDHPLFSNFTDVDGYTCNQWLGYNCTLASTAWGYSAGDAAAVASVCQRECGRYLPGLELRQVMICNHLQKRIEFENARALRRSEGDAVGRDACPPPSLNPAHAAGASCGTNGRVEAGGENESRTHSRHRHEPPAVHENDARGVPRAGLRGQEDREDHLEDTDDEEDEEDDDDDEDDEYEALQDPVALWKAAQCERVADEAWARVAAGELMEYLVPDWIGPQHKAPKGMGPRFDFNHEHRNLRVVLEDSYGYIDANEYDCSSWYMENCAGETAAAGNASSGALIWSCPEACGAMVRQTTTPTAASTNPRPRPRRNRPHPSEQHPTIPTRWRPTRVLTMDTLRLLAGASMLEWATPTAAEAAADADDAFWHSVLSFSAGWFVCMFGCLAVASVVAHAGTTSLRIQHQRIEVFEFQQLAGSATGERLADFWMGLDALLARRQHPSALANLARQRIQLRFRPNAGRVVALPTGMAHRLRVLDLQHNWLPQLPASIQLLTGLERLDLSGNLLTSLPDELGLLSTLRTLDCRDNMLTALPSSIGKLKVLNALLLDGNRLTTLPDAISELWSLRVLRLSANRLASTENAKLHLLPSLYLLTLDRNPLSKALVPPGTPESIPGLRRLTVDEPLLPALRGRCSRLEQLTVQLTSSHQVPAQPHAAADAAAATATAAAAAATATAAAAAAATVSELGATSAEEQYGNVGLAGIECIGPLAGLSLLPASRDVFLMEPPASVLMLTQLTTLRLAGMKLKRLPESVERLTSLTLLAVENNLLEELPYTLGNMHNLKTLRVHRNRLKALPVALGQLADTLNHLTVDQEPCKQLFADVAHGTSARQKATLVDANGGSDSEQASYHPSDVLAALKARLLSAPWSIKRHHQGTFGARANPMLFSTLVSARNAVNQGRLPGLPTEIWLSIFEKLNGDAFMRQTVQ